MNPERNTEAASISNADKIRAVKQELGRVPAEMLEIQCWKGPRNLPKKTGKVFRRHRQKQARKVNRGVYSGQ